jgi:NTE family protein
MSITKSKKRTKRISIKMSTNDKIMRKDANSKRKPQRALVFQGGGSLGAYEAGVFKVLYNWIKKDTKNGESLFDIVAGTSIGAINATILISHYLERKEELERKGEQVIPLKCWEGAPEKLIDFWKYVSSGSNFYTQWIQNLTFYWLKWFEMNPYIKIPSREAFRRYHATRGSLVFGEPQVFLPLFFAPFPTQYINKFLDPTPQFAWWYRYSNQPLRESIEKFAPILSDQERGIKTSYKNNEPRLILISVDIEEGATVPFDSYEKPKDRILKSEYTVQEIGNHDMSQKKSISYENGITLDHVMASASVPKNFDYIEIKGTKFWDGGLLSNTPLREVISEHTLFWKEKLGLDLIDLSFDTWTLPRETIPSLDVFIINLHPSKETSDISLLHDYDMIKDRESDIEYHDRTEYDLKVATFVSDYVALVTEMTDLSFELIKERGNSSDKVSKFDKILKTLAKSTHRSGKKRLYQDLLKNRFEINNIMKIERQDDPDTISNKILDFSSTTISNLIECGVKDALSEVVSKLGDDVNNTEEGIFSNLSNKVRQELTGPLQEMKRDLTSGQTHNNYDIVSNKHIATFYDKVSEFHKQLSDNQYNVLILSIRAIRSILKS